MSMKSYIDKGEALDVRAIGEATETAGVYRLRTFTEGVDYCDPAAGRWIWSIGRNRATGEILASTDNRFYGHAEYECIWLR